MIINPLTLSIQEQILLQDVLELPTRPIESVTLSDKQCQDYTQKQTKLLAGYPLDYLISGFDFAGYKLTVSESVFIPRPETEEIPTLLQPYLQPKQYHIIDLCCGSGACGISLSQYAKTLIFVDFSQKALETTNFNCKQNHITNYTIHQLDLNNLDQLQPILATPGSLLVCNPPYVPESDKEKNYSQSVIHEPAHAIYSGEDGLDAFRSIISAFTLSNLPEISIFELDPRNIHTAASLLQPHYPYIDILKDSQQRDRFIFAYLTKTQNKS